MKPIRILMIGIVAVLSLGLSMAQPLEGTKWKIKLVPEEDSRKAGAKEMEDAITFKGAKFSSEALVKQGFAAIEFEEDTRGMLTAQFKVDAKSTTAGTAKWTGAVTGEAVKGQLIITAKDGKVTTYNFQGEKQRN